MSELSAYGDIVIRSEAKLIPTTYLTAPTHPGDTVVNVTTTKGFIEPISGLAFQTAYIGHEAFTYTNLTPTTFTGVTFLSGSVGAINDMITQSIPNAISIQDPDQLLNKMGDRLYKDVRVNDNFNYSQVQLDSLSKAYLNEFYKDHKKLTVDILYPPYLRIGQTVSLTDPYNYIVNGLYFIESVTNKSGGIYSIQLGAYP